MVETKSSDEGHKAMVRGIRMAIGSSKLETVVRVINSFFKGLNPPLKLDQLPEYQKALDAIKAYSEAVVSELDRRYKEDSKER